MPPKGFKSITVKQAAYDMLMEEYKKTPDKWLIKHGITSFNGYVNYRLEELVQYRKQLLQQTDQEKQQPP